MRTGICKIFFLLIISFLHAQKDEKLVFEGNQLLKTGRLDLALSKYQEALKINPNNTAARFNLGNALFRSARALKTDTTGKIPVPGGIPRDSAAKLLLDQAISYYEPITQRVSNKDTLQKTWHNIGNAWLWKENYDQAIDAYKKALKINPKDEDTRYNLAYALSKRKQQNQGGGGKNNQPNQQQQQQQKQEMNKEDADKILKAIMQAEQKLHNKKKQNDSQKTKPEKDW
jgi:tetratricopeptide (TPR) repeat protein